MIAFNERFLKNKTILSAREITGYLGVKRLYMKFIYLFFGVLQPTGCMNKWQPAAGNRSLCEFPA